MTFGERLETLILLENISRQKRIGNPLHFQSPFSADAALHQAIIAASVSIVPGVIMRINDVPSRPFQRQIGQIRRKMKANGMVGRHLGHVRHLL